MPAPKSEQPPQEKKPEAAPPAKKADAQPQGELDEAQRKALADDIRRQVESTRQNPPAKKPTTPPVTPTPAAAPGIPGADATAPTAPQTPAAAEASHKKEGCGGHEGGSGISFTPPPPDQPQPKFKPGSLKVESETWIGRQVSFAVEFTNEGEGPLAIRLKGG